VFKEGWTRISAWVLRRVITGITAANPGRTQRGGERKEGDGADGVGRSVSDRAGQGKRGVSGADVWAWARMRGTRGV